MHNLISFLCDCISFQFRLMEHHITINSLCDWISFQFHLMEQHYTINSTFMSILQWHVIRLFWFWWSCFFVPWDVSLYLFDSIEFNQSIEFSLNEMFFFSIWLYNIPIRMPFNWTLYNKNPVVWIKIHFLCYKLLFKSMKFNWIPLNLQLFSAHKNCIAVDGIKYDSVKLNHSILLNSISSYLFEFNGTSWFKWT